MLVRETKDEGKKERREYKCVGLETGNTERGTDSVGRGRDTVKQEYLLYDFKTAANVYFKSMLNEPKIQRVYKPITVLSFEIIIHH